ncbi:unnamed protein product, partial [Amoebophrya sp. A25]
ERQKLRQLIVTAIATEAGVPESAVTVVLYTGSIIIQGTVTFADQALDNVSESEQTEKPASIANPNPVNATKSGYAASRCSTTTC